MSTLPVPQLFLETIDRTFEKCDADGFELDFMRHPYFFKPDEAAGKLDVMTGVVRTARERLDEIGKAQGRRLELGALVPALPEVGREKGLDVLTWIEEGLLDYVVPKHFIKFLMDVPIADYLKAAEGTVPRVYACMENWPEPEAGDPIESFRGAASSYWSQGVDGVYLYNYFNHRPHLHTEADRQVLHEIGDPQLIQRKDKRITLKSVEEDDGYQLPLALTGDHTIRFTLADDAQSAADEWSLSAVKLRLDLNDLIVEEDLLEIELNGAPLSFEEAKKPYHHRGYIFKRVEIDLTDGPLPQMGSNDLRIRLVKRCPGMTDPLTLTQLDLTIRYR